MTQETQLRRIDQSLSMSRNVIRCNIKICQKMNDARRYAQGVQRTCQDRYQSLCDAHARYLRKAF